MLEHPSWSKPLKKPVFYKRDWFINYTPIASTILLEGANIQQMMRMWTEQTAEGQSLMAWSCVQIALWLWYNFYKQATPDKKWAIRCQGLGIGLNGLVILTVLYFRWL
jgi:hypothetical protein